MQTWTFVCIAKTGCCTQGCRISVLQSPPHDGGQTAPSAKADKEAAVFKHIATMQM